MHKVRDLLHVTVENLKQQIRELDASLEDDDPGLQHAVVLIASTRLGTDPEVLATFTGYPLEFVKTVESRVRVAKIWQGEKVDSSDWFSSPSELALDVLVARGEMIRKPGAGFQGWTYIPCCSN